MQNENIAMISSVYHNAILTHTGLELTVEEIDNALEVILRERQRFQPPTNTGEPSNYYSVHSHQSVYTDQTLQH